MSSSSHSAGHHDACIERAIEALAFNLAEAFDWHSASSQDSDGEHWHPSQEDMIHALNEPFPVAAVITALLELCEVPCPALVRQAMQTCTKLPI